MQTPINLTIWLALNENTSEKACHSVGLGYEQRISIRTKTNKNKSILKQNKINFSKTEAVVATLRKNKRWCSRRKYQTMTVTWQEDRRILIDR